MSGTQLLWGFLGLVLEWLPTIILVATTAVMIWRDPRRMRCAIFLGLTLAQIYLTVQLRFVSWLEALVPQDTPYLLLAFLVFVVLMVIAVSVFLIWAGLVLVLREGVSTAHLLSLALGVGILLYLVLGVVAALTGALVAFVYLVLLIFPVAMFAFILFSYLLYSGLYGLWVRKWAKPGEVVVVLGSGLIGDRVPPLLARRLDLGIATYLKALSVWEKPVLVVSGGKGSDEAISEAEGMARYVRGQDAAVERLILEDQSVSTEQNIQFTRQIVQGEGVLGPWTAVTSDFHAFRAAMLLSEQKIPGNAIGAKSVKYFWASAKLREMIAILAAYPRWTVAAVVFSSLPLLFGVLAQIAALVGG